MHETFRYGVRLALLTVWLRITGSNREANTTRVRERRHARIRIAQRKGTMESTSIDVTQYRQPDHDIERIFWQRWSPRALEPAELDDDQLGRLFEAARWAPSSYNRQPWRFLYARRGTDHWNTFFGLLSEGNRSWADDAGALVVVLSRRRTEDGQPIRTHSYDAGAAWENLALQAVCMNLVVHGMEGFDYERARADLAVPDDFEIEAMAAIGRPGRVEELAEKDRKREKPRDRLPVEQIAIEGSFPETR